MGPSIRSRAAATALGVQSAAVTTRRVSRGVTATSARPRAQHSIAPAHLGEAASVALLTLAVLGIALVITGIGVVAMGLTIGSRYAGVEPPPDMAGLGLGPTLGGFGLIALGIGLVAGSIAVLSEVSRARFVTGALASLSAILAAGGAVLAMASIPPDPIVAVALTLLTLAFGVSAILMLRRAAR